MGTIHSILAGHTRVPPEGREHSSLRWRRCSRRRRTRPSRAPNRKNSPARTVKCGTHEAIAALRRPFREPPRLQAPRVAARGSIRRRRRSRRAPPAARKPRSQTGPPSDARGRARQANRISRGLEPQTVRHFFTLVVRGLRRRRPPQRRRLGAPLLRRDRNRRRAARDDRDLRVVLDGALALERASLRSGQTRALARTCRVVAIPSVPARRQSPSLGRSPDDAPAYLDGFLSVISTT